MQALRGNPRSRRAPRARALHVYGACLVQGTAGHEQPLWVSGPVLAWDRSEAVVQAYFLALPHARRPADDPAIAPRLKVWRVGATRHRAPAKAAR